MHQNWQMLLNNLNLSTNKILPSNIRKSNMLFDLSSYGLLRVDGPDAKKLLQGQLTCDVEKLNHGQLGAHCNPQGRVISLFYLFHANDIYFLLMPRNIITIAMSALKKYAVFYKTNIQDASDDYLIVGTSHELAEQLIESSSVMTIPICQTHSILVGKFTELKTVLQQLSSPFLVRTINDWKRLNINASIPQIYPETSEKLLPHELNLDQLNAVNFDKGCYTGQEIIARMHYRGKLKNHLYRAIITQAALPAPGANIYARINNEIKTVGNIIDACTEDANHIFILLVTDEQNAKNNHLILDRENFNFITILNE